MGLLRGIARTAVISGTATAVSNNVSRRQAQRWAGQQAEEEQVVVQQQTVEQTSDPYEEIAKLSQLKDQGIITQEEFDAKKHQLLGL